MKRLIASTLILLAPAMLLAKTPAENQKKPVAKAKASSKTQASPSGKGSVVAKSKKSTTTSSRTQLHSAATQVAAGIRAADAALTPAELAIAEQVHTGQLPCELGASVKLERDAAMPGYFNLYGKGFSYRVHPVETSTGAVRLEDKAQGAVWIQLANKSMLMDQKLGRRLADECASPSQVAVAESLRKNPAPSLLEPLPASK